MSGLTGKIVNMDDLHKYDDIIDLPHHQSKYRPHMDVSRRAAQFAAFDALAGRSESEKERQRMIRRSGENA